MSLDVLLSARLFLQEITSHQVGTEQFRYLWTGTFLAASNRIWYFTILESIELFCVSSKLKA